MTYQALARKWRPRLFSEIVGQTHVVSALTHALDNNRVHHAFLFAGTRGVGKTTLARILAKCLNCEAGVSSQPCNQCSACESIDEGRFVDLIEVDAASRTKVDDTRELLDNVQYAPTQGRYKIYLIDEVHMLSGHSFNALLKTLEEPPPHVKFLLATTDPQKLPVTVLSRCLQFNLKALQPDQISQQLNIILESESIPFDSEALAMLARSADGSMRDGLSLLDQAIAQGDGKVESPSVRQMLGLIDTNYISDLIKGLVKGNIESVFQVIDQVAENAGDYTQLVDDLLLQLFNLALYQQDPKIAEAKQVMADWYPEVANAIHPEELQLYYQICLLGKRDLPLAPSLRIGFEMLMLRLLAFTPEKTEKITSPDGQGSNPAVSAADPKAESNTASTDSQSAESSDWSQIARLLPLQSWTAELAMNLALSEKRSDRWLFTLDPKHEHLYNDERRKEIEQAISDQLGSETKIDIKLIDSANETPIKVVEKELLEKQKQAELSMENDPEVQNLIKQFDATLVKETIRPR